MQDINDNDQESVLKFEGERLQPQDTWTYLGHFKCISETIGLIINYVLFHLNLETKNLLKNKMLREFQ